jgi:hypothetical protein
MDIDDYRQDITQRLDRIERKMNEAVSAFMLAAAVACAFGVGDLASWAVGYFWGKMTGDAVGGIAGVIAFYAAWLHLHKNIIERH